MSIRLFGAALVGAVVLATGLWVERAQAQEGQYIPALVYRTGPFAPNGIPSANGWRDYMTMINKRDGGVDGVLITWEECEFGYGTAPGVECYERLKNNGGGASLVNPFSTGVTYALIPKANVDEVAPGIGSLFSSRTMPTSRVCADTAASAASHAAMKSGSQRRRAI